MFTVPSGAPLKSQGLGGVGKSCRFSPDGNYLAVGTTSGHVYVFNTADYSPKWMKNTDGSATIYGVDFSPDSKYLLTGWSSSGFIARIFNVETGGT